MPMYNELCEACQSEDEVLVSYTDFMASNSKETAHICKHCGEKTAFYSLSRLLINLKADLDTAQSCVIRSKSTALQYLEGFSKKMGKDE